MQAEFYQGSDILTMDYTPGSAVDAGTVVVVNDIVGIAISDLPANELGSLNINGGIYKVTGDAAIAAGKTVYWNDTANKVTETASTHKKFGKTVTACSGDGESCYVAHLSL